MVEEWWSFAQKGDFVGGKPYFKHIRLHKYTRVARSQDGVEVKSMINLVLVKRDMMRYVQDVREVRGMGRSLSDHHDILCKVRLVVKRWLRGERGGGWSWED